VVDAVISGGVGGGFLASMLASMFLGGTSLAFIANSVVPVSDSIIVLVLCAVIARQPVMMFLKALRQVAGAAAAPDSVDKVRKHLQGFLRERPYELLEVAVTKMGRMHFVVSYVKPDAAIDAESADALWQDLDGAIRDLLGQVRTELVIAKKPPFDN
jgi:predicted Co/Zn/Cd cation transporter (cation efflux family)